MALIPARTVSDTALKAIQTGPLPVGAVGVVGSGFTVVEQGVGTNRRTILTLTAALSIVTTPDAEDLADGLLIYTFPAGQIIVHRVYGDVAFDINDAANVGDQPEVGLGTTIAAGANATLGAAATGAEAENMWGPHVLTGVDAINDTGDAIQQVSTLEFVMPGADPHLCHLNIADAWANGAGTDDVTVEAARFVIDWTLLPIEGV